MNLEILEYEDFYLNKLKEDFKNSFIDIVSDNKSSKYIYSFYFKKKLLQFRRYFSLPENFIKLQKFFNIDYTVDINDIKKFKLFWESVFPKLDRLMIEVVGAHADCFVLDKRLSIYAKRFILLQRIDELIMYYKKESEYKLNIYKENSKYSLVVTYSKNNIYTDIMSYKILNVFSDEFINEMIYFDKNSKKYFGKDILSVLIKLIKSESCTIDNVNLETFFEDKEVQIEDNTTYYLTKIKDIIKTNKFLRKRKSTPIKSVTKRNFTQFFSTFIYEQLNNKVCEPFDKYLKKRGIIFKDFRIEQNVKFKHVIKKSMLYIKCDDILTTSNDNHLLLYNDSIEKCLESEKRYLILKNNYGTISNYINARKYSYKTKKMLIDRTLLMNIHTSKLPVNIQTYLNTFLELIDLFKSFDINEKIIRGYLSKFLDPKNYFSSNICKDMLTEEDVSRFYYDKRKSHDIYVSNLRYTLDVFKRLSKINFKNKIFISSYINLLSALNLDTNSLDKIKHFNSKLDILSLNFNNMDDIKLKSLTQFNDLVSKIEKLKFEMVINNISKKLTVENIGFDLAGKMGAHINYIKLLENIMSNDIYLKQYYEQNLITDNLINNYDKYNISITKHNDSIGLLGANVKGVCINSYNSHRLDQVSKEFLNLSIYNNGSGVMLWGLLCRAESKDKVIYILNNLQGSINLNKEESEILLNEIYSTLETFMKNNNIHNVWFLDHGFNRLKLQSQFRTTEKEVKEFTLNKKIRLDFNLDNSIFYKLTKN